MEWESNHLHEITFWVRISLCCCQRPNEGPAQVFVAEEKQKIINHVTLGRPDTAQVVSLALSLAIYKLKPKSSNGSLTI